MKSQRKYMESKIEEILWSMRSDFSKLTMMWEYTPEEDKRDMNYIDDEEHMRQSFENKVKTAYKIILVYLETFNLKEYLSDFKEEFSKIIDDKEKLFDSSMTYDGGDIYSETVNKFWIYLSPFEFSQQAYLDKLLKSEGIFYLETILRNTQVIINGTGVKPSTEPQVYKAVKLVIESVFTGTLKPTSGFFKSFKNYQPDILIPEIYTAVEYKYADNENKLKSQIDQVIADTKGYTGDPNYKIFYAVFYVTDDFWGIDKFKNVWKEMKFPKSWKGIYVVGKK